MAEDRATAPSAARRGVLAVLAGTLVAGVSGYVIQGLAPVVLSTEDYLSFSVFWSALYMVGTALVGVQQELARATSPRRPGPERSAGVVRRFAATFGSVVVVLAVVVALTTAAVLFPASPGWLGTWFVVGVAGYFSLVLVTGMLFGINKLTGVALIVTVDALLRGTAVGIAFLLGAGVSVVAALVALPFGLAVLAGWLVVRRQVVGQIEVDVPVRRLVTQAAVTATAGACTGLMVTGIPLLLQVAVPADPTVLAGLILIITLTRAPLIVPLMSLQSYLVVQFRDHPDTMARRLTVYGIGVLALGGVAAVVAWLWADDIAGLLSGGRYSVGDWTAVGVIVSAALVGLMCVTGSGLLARSEHGWYGAVWVLSALVTVGGVLLPLETVPRVLTALIAGPAVGVVAYVVVLAGRLRADRALPAGTAT